MRNEIAICLLLVVTVAWRVDAAFTPTTTTTRSTFGIFISKRASSVVLKAQQQNGIVFNNPDTFGMVNSDFASQQRQQRKTRANSNNNSNSKDDNEKAVEQTEAAKTTKESSPRISGQNAIQLDDPDHLGVLQNVGISQSTRAKRITKPAPKTTTTTKTAPSRPPPPPPLAQQQQKQGIALLNPDGLILSRDSSVIYPQRRFIRQPQQRQLPPRPPPPQQRVPEQATEPESDTPPDSVDTTTEEEAQEAVNDEEMSIPPSTSTETIVDEANVVSVDEKEEEEEKPQESKSCLKLTDPVNMLLDKTDVFIFDCDGVIWKGNSLLPGVATTLDKLKEAGKKVLFLTNSSSQSREGFRQKMQAMGLNDIDVDNIFSSSFAAAFYLDEIVKLKERGKKAYVIGEGGICDELQNLSIPYIGGPDDAHKVPNMGPGGMVRYDSDVGAVVVGFDRYINYYKVQYAQLCLNENEGCEFIATNLDSLKYLTNEQAWAECGAMVGAIKGCTGREPTVVGKPSPLMIDYICDNNKMEDRSRICMVGDRLDTDMVFGKDNGLQTLLVLSGVTTEEQLTSPENTVQPDFYADSINDLFPGTTTTEETSKNDDNNPNNNKNNKKKKNKKKNKNKSTKKE